MNRNLDHAAETAEKSTAKGALAMTVPKVKVYELAKELGMESIALLEKLRSLDIDVKNHMSSLGTEEVRTVREHLAKEQALLQRASKATKRKDTEPVVQKRVGTTVIRRRVTVSSDAHDPAIQTPMIEEIRHDTRPANAMDIAAPVVAVEITPASAPETDEVPQPDLASAQGTEATTNDLVLESNLSGTAEVGTLEAAPEALTGQSTTSPTVETSETAVDHTEAHSDPRLAPPLATIAGQSVDVSGSQSEAQSGPTTPLSSPAPEKPHSSRTLVRSVGTTTTSQTTSGGSVIVQRVTVRPLVGAASPSGTTNQTSTSPATPSPAATLKGSGLKFHSLLGARGAGIAPVKPASIINIVKEEPKKAAPRVVPNVRPNVGGRPAPVAPRFNTGIVNLGKEAIDRLVEEEQGFKKRGGTGKGEKDPLDVRVADYRAKKELVFMPKKKRLPVNREIKATTITTPAAHKRVIRIDNTVVLSELAQRMGVKATELIRKLMGMGVMATMNHPLDLETATLIAAEFGHEIENVAFSEQAVITKEKPTESDVRTRPPVVTVMGHVDHGKTSLLDAIRSAKVAAGEAGGITQHIGGYSVRVNDKDITFIDTPGHEAFTVMRARGANVTDIVVLVVAADDGVMPQTREAVSHAQAANVPIIVAVNKMDKPGANPERVMKGLSELGLLSEAWGGQNIFVNVSALKGTGISSLLESVLLQAEVMDLKADYAGFAEGTVLEAKLDRSRGPVLDVLVKKGVLRLGDPLVAGPFSGKVRAMSDDQGRPLKEVLPGFAAEVLGLDGTPTAGVTFNTVASESDAKALAEHRVDQQRSKDMSRNSKISLDVLFAKAQQGDLKELPVILKTDVFGSTEAIRESLLKLSTDKVKIKMLSAGTGGISESDVMLASASNAIILGFNVRPETKARAIAEAEGVEIKSYSIIYQLLDDMKKAMGGLLDKKAVEVYSGRAEVRELFHVPKVGTVAGCSVIDGKIGRQCQVRLLRDSRVIYTGKLASLRRFKDDAKEVAQGYECGIGIENFNDVKQGDIVEAFTIDMIAQTLESASASTSASSSTAGNTGGSTGTSTRG